MGLHNLCELCQGIFEKPWIAKKDVQGADVNDDKSEERPVELNEEQYVPPQEDADDCTDEGSLFDNEDFYERADWVQLLSTQTETTNVEYRTPMHHDIESLKRSAGNDCHLCTMLWDVVQYKLREDEPDPADLLQAIGAVLIRPETFNDVDGDDDVDFDDDDNDDKDFRSSKLDMEISYFKNGEHQNSNMYLFTVSLTLWPISTDWNSVASSLWSRKSSNDSTQGLREVHDESSELSTSTHTQLVQFLQDCTLDHTRLKVEDTAPTGVRSDHSLPTRLLDLGPPDRQCNISVRSSSGFDPQTRYITLSHCWGRDLPRLRLLKNNHRILSEVIRMEDLPSTFRDAVQVTKKLGLRYLWIDSLCIIQDSSADWDREAHRMASVYSQAYANLAATCALNSEGGLMPDRNAFLATPCQVTCHVYGHKASDFLVVDEAAWKNRVDGGPLNSRAWVLQERLLAARTIHFASDQIWWECAHFKACETFPMGLPYNDEMTVPTDFMVLQNFRSRPQDTAADAVWLPIVKAYSNCNLTFPSDKLVALAGLAQSVQEHLMLPPTDYLAGLWREDICVDMLWRLQAAGARYERFVAPTWSWASVKGSVYFNDDNSRTRIHENLQIRLIEATTIPTPNSRLGSVTGGFLVLHGRLCPISLSDIDITKPNWPRITGLTIGEAEYMSEDKFGEALDDESLYIKFAGSKLDTMLLPFMTTPNPHLLGDFMSEGLILEPTGALQGEYRRLGWIRIFHAERTLIEEQLSAFCSPQYYLQNGQRTIRLI